MKAITVFATLILMALLFAIVPGSRLVGVSAQDTKKPPETIVLAKESKLGQVTFKHTAHFTENRSADGKKTIACVECHHTAQPASEAEKHPPHKTAWPADRTTTLTAELLEKDPAVTKPKLLPEIPKLKVEGGDELVLTNQQAFHRNCGGCHDEAVKARPDLNPAPPTSKKCVACHKKAPAA